MVKRRKSKVMRSERFTTSVSRVVEYGSVGVLGLLLLTMLFPTVNRSTYATCADGTSTEECTVTQAETEPEVTVKTSLAVSMDNKAAMEVVPTSKGATTIGTTNLTVATNSVDGYSLYMQSSDGLTNTSTLHEGNDLLAEKISITEQDSTLSNMKNNRYGYYLGDTAASSNTVFSALPTTNTIIKQTTSTTGSVADTDYNYGDSYVLSFGVKVGTELPAGIYSGSVTMSAVANPETVQSMAGLTYMQDMTSDICTNTREGYTKQLIDTRDGKSYWVAKLKDGNCWMTQNLALDLGTGDNPNLKYVAKLTPADSDVSEEWVPTSATNAVKFSGVNLSLDINNQYSWNMGEMVLATPLQAKSCKTTHNGNTDPYNSAISSDNLSEVCAEAGFIDVSEGDWQPTFVAQAGYLLDAEQPLIAAQYNNPEVKENGGVYDAHYLIGNYYQFNTVTAGSGASITALNAVVGNSICPKGWMLPAAGKNDDNQPIVNLNQNKASFYQLLSAYGYPKTGGWSLNGTTAQMAIKHRNENVEDNVAAGPMFFVRGGLIDVGAGYLRVPGANAYLWSSTIMSDSHAFFYAFYNYDVMPTIAYNKNYVFPARCVAR